MKCSDCKYFERRSEKDGECRRFPPGIVYDSDDGCVLSNFPGVFHKEWCGEFKKTNALDKFNKADKIFDKFKSAVNELTKIHDLSKKTNT